MTVVYIHQKDGQWANENAYLAYRGFYERGYEIKPYSLEAMSAGSLPLTKETIVHGGVQQVYSALQQLGLRTPRYETYPYPLRKYLDRNPREVRLAEVIEAVQTPGFRPVFIKPSQDHKAFTGLVVSAFADLLRLNGVSDQTWVWKAHVVHFLSEYRAFFHKGELVGLRHYKGDPLIFPDPTVVKKIVASAKSLPQVAFAIDVGVANFPDRPEVIRTPTLMVEANDGHSLGSYGLPAHIYCQMIEDRWKQMVGTS